MLALGELADRDCRAAETCAVRLADRLAEKTTGEVSAILSAAAQAALSVDELRARLEARFEEWDAAGAELLAANIASDFERRETHRDDV